MKSDIHPSKEYPNYESYKLLLGLLVNTRSTVLWDVEVLKTRWSSR